MNGFVEDFLRNYDRSMEAGSEDPTDPASTTRAFTVIVGASECK
ncbi:DUF3768 domain-containing protein [Bradyrhizobium sp. JYMT SZCCT0180]|nr:DUF3768 domain-containing protein [Bradyrhizobium sp. JYMT SZCCT0180]MBR1216162.1 DUF3768 domain-containing protein [Bradyrhizobium sp. JYMT SZCCT0180]